MASEWKITIRPTAYVLQKRGFSPVMVENYDAQRWWTVSNNLDETHIVIQLEYGPAVKWPMSYVESVHIERRNHEQQGKAD